MYSEMICVHLRHYLILLRTKKPPLLFSSQFVASLRLCGNVGIGRQ